jgi:uncharacterized protein YcnI
MNLITRSVPRALILAAMTATALYAATTTAWAHVEVDANNAVRGGEAILTFQVPNESDKGAQTTQFSVALPNVTSASTELMPGWTAKLDRDTAAGTTRSVSWTAGPNVGIAPDQFTLFRVAVTLPNTDTVTFPATQTYSDGTVVRWDQPPLPGGGEPEHPGTDADPDRSTIGGTRAKSFAICFGEPGSRTGAGIVATGTGQHRTLAGRRRTGRRRAWGGTGTVHAATVMKAAASALLGVLLAVLPPRQRRGPSRNTPLETWCRCGHTEARSNQSEWLME